MRLAGLSLFALVAACAAVPTVAPGQARPHVNGAKGGSGSSAPPPPTGVCAYDAAGYPDGCDAAPAGTVIYPNGPTASWDSVVRTHGLADLAIVQSNATPPFGTGPTGVGTATTNILAGHPQPFNVAGWDYAVGPAAAPTVDPSVQANLPAGCTVSGSSAFSVTCTMSTGNSITLNNMDFSLHNGIFLQVQGSSTNPADLFLVKNSKFKRGTNQIGQFIRVVKVSSGPYSYEFRNDEFDGNDAALPMLVTWGDELSESEANPTFNTAYTGTFDYNYIHNTAQRFATGSFDTALVYRNNLSVDTGNETEVHGELIADDGALTNVSNYPTTVWPRTYTYNTNISDPTIPTASSTASFVVLSSSKFPMKRNETVIGNTTIVDISNYCQTEETCSGTTVGTAFIDDGATPGTYDGVPGNMITFTSVTSGPRPGGSQIVKATTRSDVPTTYGILDIWSRPSSIINVPMALFSGIPNVTVNKAIPPETFTVGGKLSDGVAYSVALLSLENGAFGTVDLEANYVYADGATDCVSLSANGARGDASNVLGVNPATAIATLSGGGVASIAVTFGSFGYNSIPSVTIAAPPSGGTQALATATISGGQVVSIAVTNAGSGYVSTPSVTIKAPSAASFVDNGAGNGVYNGTSGTVLSITSGKNSAGVFYTGGQLVNGSGVQPPAVTSGAEIISWEPDGSGNGAGQYQLTGSAQTIPPSRAPAISDPIDTLIFPHQFARGQQGAVAANNATYANHGSLVNVDLWSGDNIIPGGPTWSLNFGGYTETCQSSINKRY